MNANCKRLLSWLIVLTMVLSMVPVFDLSNFAVTTKAADYVNLGQSKIEEGAAVIKAAKDLGTFAAGGVSAICPVCSSETEVEWKDLNSEAATTGKDGHYYLSGEITTTITAASGKTLCLNLNGQNVNVSNAQAITLSNTTVNILNTAPTESTVTGTSQDYGAAIHVNGANASGTANIYGGIFKKVSTNTQCPIVAIGTNGGTINMYAGTINAEGIENAGFGTNSNTTYPSAVNLQGGTTDTTKATFNMYGDESEGGYNAEIIGGTADGMGGAVRLGYAAGRKAYLNLYGGTIRDGKSRNSTKGQVGGNICVNGGELNIHGGTIKDGKYARAYAMGGGNVAVTANGTLNMYAGTISGGDAGTGSGGNIFVRPGYYGKVNISGGKIIDGKSTTNGANISIEASTTQTTFSTLTISGTAAISGGVYTSTGVTTTLSGTPVIKTSGVGETVTGTIGLNVTGTSNIDVDGLASGAEIQVTGDKDVVFTKTGEDASGVAQYFTHTNSSLMVKANDSKQLYIADYEAPAVPDPVIGEFDPEGCGGMAYCDACIKQGVAGADTTPVKWTKLTNSSTLTNLKGHCYLGEDITQGITGWGNDTNVLCLNLNGCDITATDALAIGQIRGTVSIMDTVGESTVTGVGTANSQGIRSGAGAALHVNSNATTLYIYGGTFMKTEDATSVSVVGIGASGGTIHMYEGVTIDASGTTTTGWAGTINIMGNSNGTNKGTFNMHGGIIKCGEMSSIHTNYGGNIHLGYYNYNGGATFNMYAGTVIGGKCIVSETEGGAGAFAVSNNNTLNIFGGTVYGGESSKLGGNIFIRSGLGTVNISGGTVVGDVCIAGEGTIKLSGDAKIVKELTIDGVEVTAKKTALNLASGITADITGLTADAEIYIEGQLDTALTTGNGATTGIKAYDANQVVDVVNDEVYLRQAVAAVGETKYGNVEDAIAAADDSYVKLLADAEFALSGDAYVDANGKNVTVTGEGTLYAMDSANDTYDETKCGTWTVTGPEVVNDVINPVNGKRYIVIEDGEGYTAHRVELYLPKVTLRSSQAGIYFHASYKCDTTLAARVGNYGVALSALDDVDTTLETVRNVNSGVKLTVLSKFAEAMDENTTVSSTSSLVKNIFKKDATDNNARGDITIKATPYFVVDINGDGSSINDYNGEAYYVVGNAEGYEIDDAIKGATYASVTMNSVLTKVNWATLTDEQKNYILAWADWGVTLPGNIG